MKHLYQNTRAMTLLLLLMATTISYAQTSISGKVSDENGALPGVNITVKGSIAGTPSDSDGNFSFTTKSPPPLTIVVSFVGYKSTEISDNRCQYIRAGNKIGIRTKCNAGSRLNR